jgi:hypothetical protein
VIKEIENILHKKYDETHEEFVEIEEKCDGKTEKKID